MRQGALLTGRVSSKKTKNGKKKKKKYRRTQNTPRNPQQLGDPDHLERACDETRPTPPYSPAFKDPEFVEIGFVQLSQSVKIESYTYTVVHRQNN